MIPVLEVGGTHVSAALVSPGDWTVTSASRHSVDAAGSADDVLAGWLAAARAIDAPAGAPWGVAMPDPFDYPAGVARFDAAVAKFGALNGVDVGAALRSALASEVAFLNDADAFALGEWTCGAGVGIDRLVAVTLGTGVGSGWVVGGQVVDPGVPAGGRIHTMTVEGRPLEDVFSRRAIRREFVAAGGSADLDVREISALARAGDARATGVLSAAAAGLGGAVGAAVRGFRADLLVLGGSMAASWNLLDPWFRAGAGDLPPIAVSPDAERSGFVGAAAHTLRSTSP